MFDNDVNKFMTLQRLIFQWRRIISHTNAFEHVTIKSPQTRNSRTTLSDEIDHDEVEQNVREDEVCECPLRTDARKLALVLGIDLPRNKSKSW